jgi:hypothetical protein
VGHAVEGRHERLGVEQGGQHQGDGADEDDLPGRQRAVPVGQTLRAAELVGRVRHQNWK